MSARIAAKLYPTAEITAAGFETTSRHDFFDLAVGNVPFGQYQVNDPAFQKLGFSIHDYFFAKTLEPVSYTHLDVYKRQFDARLIQIETDLVVFEGLRSDGTVSYTHLWPKLD